MNQLNMPILKSAPTMSHSTEEGKTIVMLQRNVSMPIQESPLVQKKMLYCKLLQLAKNNVTIYWKM